MPRPPLRVLCVDDNPDAAESLALLLTAAGAEVRVCYDGGQALAEAEAFAPNAAILDVRMPRADGCAVARLLRAAAGNRPLLLVAVTGENTEEARGRTAAAGFDRHLTKPADPDELLRILEEFAARY